MATVELRMEKKTCLPINFHLLRKALYSDHIPSPHTYDCTQINSMKLSAGALSALLFASASQAFVPASRRMSAVQQRPTTTTAAAAGVAFVARPGQSLAMSSTAASTDKETYEFTVRSVPVSAIRPKVKAFSVRAFSHYSWLSLSCVFLLARFVS